MADNLLLIVAGLAVVVLILQIVLLVKSSSGSNIDTAVRDELRATRQETLAASGELRAEVGTAIRAGNEAVTRGIATITVGQAGHLKSLQSSFAEMAALHQGSNSRISEAIAAGHSSHLKTLQTSFAEMAALHQGANARTSEAIAGGTQAIIQASDRKAEEMRREMAGTQIANRETMVSELREIATGVRTLVDGNQTALAGIRDTLDARIKELQSGVEVKVGDMRTEVTGQLKDQDERIGHHLGSARDSQQLYLEKLIARLGEMSTAIQNSLDTARTSIDSRLQSLTEANHLAFDRVNGTLNQGLSTLQESNERKLEEMRATVDEKLQSTLDQRLGESFRQVSERLEAVHKGLGEMQHLATGVGDLKRVLTNVKTRGTWAEVQLGGILDQVLTADQYAKNVAVNPESAERVEFALKLPGPGDDPAKCVWLPLDSKFPTEDYQRLTDAADAGDADAGRLAIDALNRAVRLAAKDISEKYVVPPHTTDFAIMFLPTEGLYAEVARQGGLMDELQQKYRVVVVGPSNLAAFLCSIRMGFQSISLQRHTDDVWKVLGAVKTEFGKFGGVLDRVQKNLETAARAVEETGMRSRAMERKLRNVQAITGADAETVLSLGPAAGLLSAPDPAEKNDSVQSTPGGAIAEEAT